LLKEATAKLSIVRRCNATKRVLEKIDNPTDMGAIRDKLSREDIYEDIV